jgi:GT2 family glycosyltransferase
MQISRSIKKIFKQKFKLNYVKKKPKKIKLIRKKIVFNQFENPIVSIIIPFYNQEKFTWNCLQHLNDNLSNKYPYEIILIDDNSPEASDFSLIEGIKLIKNTTNLGFLKNINKGIKTAKGEYIYILNNDTEVEEYFLEELFFVFENFRDVGAVGSMLLNPDYTLQEAGSLFVKDFDIHQIVRHKKPHHAEVNYIYKVDYCSGCSLLFKKNKDDGKTLNLFDETFAPAYFEETDFCFDLKYNQNKNIYYTPFSKVIHYNGVSYNGENKSSVESTKRKENLFKVNKEKFGNKWKSQIESIKASTLEERIIEKYDNKSIVFVLEHMPEHDKDSGSNRLKEIMKGFINNGYHITLVVTKTRRNPPYNDPYIKFYERMGINVFYSEYRFESDFLKFIIKNNINVNLVWYYGPDAFKKNHSEFKKNLTHAKYIYDMIDIHHLRFLNALEIDPKKSHKSDYEYYKEIETEYIDNADYVIAISESEKDYMKSFFNNDNLIVISNIHYPKIKTKNLIHFSDRKDILFIGSIHHPNVTAINFLYNSIMPIVWDKFPEIKVNIIGNIDQVIKNFNDERFIFHGYVSNVDYLFNNSKLMVAPLQIGAGVKGKIGQAFEYYLPVITTTVGADGMFLTDNLNVLIADEANSFAEKIIQLYNDESIWNKLSQNSEKSLYPFSIEKLNKTIVETFN